MENPTKKPRGRPRKPPEEKLHRMTLFFAAPEVAKIERNTAEWLRGVVRRAKEPKAGG